MKLKRVIRLTQPAGEPLSLQEAKEQLRIPSAQKTEDTVVTGFISAAREQAEQFIDQAICQATFVLVYDEVYGASAELKYPANSVSAVTYRDQEDVEQSADFTYDAQLNKLFFGEELSGTGLKVTITAGLTSSYPQSLVQAIKLLVADLYSGRSSAEHMNKAAQMMLMPFKNRPIV